MKKILIVSSDENEDEITSCLIADTYYRASDIDAMITDVRALVAAVGEYAGLAGGVHEHGCPEDDTCSCHVMVRFEKAIAAVEARLNEVPNG